MATEWDTLIQSATVFDGSGGPPAQLDVAFRGRQVAALGIGLPTAAAKEVVDGQGQWLLPGLLDIHTHYDLEVELAPQLPEAVRHGTTTVVMSNCSLGLAYGHQRKPETGQDPITDCFARVENMPKSILSKAADKATWTTSLEYLQHFDGLPLGPNVVPMIPHSMLRIQVMGLEAAISRGPTETELDEMVALLERAMDEGYVGFSTDALPFHYLANDPNRKIKIPSQHIQRRELRRLTDVLRRRDRLWQATPPKDNPLDILRTFALTSGRLFGRPLRLTAVAAMDLVTNRSLAVLGLVMSRVFNSAWLDGRFRLQALAAPFKTWAEGPITPLAEEVPELRELNEPDLEDADARRAVLRNASFRDRFVKMWTRGRHGWSLARLARLLRRENVALTRELEDMVVSRCPVEVWEGEDLKAVYQRLVSWQRDRSGSRSEAETAAFADAPDLRHGPYIGNDAAFLLYLFERFDTELVWWTVTANTDPARTKQLLTHPLVLPGFNDSGAHITNMAFHDANLRGLRIVQEDGLEAVARHVCRLTAEPAELFGLVGIGKLQPGLQADAVLVDPEKLRAYDPDASVTTIHRDIFDHEQLVNRPDGVVRKVWIAGQLAWSEDGPSAALGRASLGRCLTAGVSPAHALEAAPVAEPASEPAPVG